jgi:hypothetical protein
MRGKPASGAKPSDGLEPSTPSLPCAPNGNWSQPTATVLACFCAFQARSICHRLPLVAPARLHKRSILFAQIRGEKTDLGALEPGRTRDHLPWVRGGRNCSSRSG